MKLSVVGITRQAVNDAKRAFLEAESTSEFLQRKKSETTPVMPKIIGDVETHSKGGQISGKADSLGIIGFVFPKRVLFKTQLLSKGFFYQRFGFCSMSRSSSLFVTD